MLQIESNYPHTLAQWFYIVLAWFLGNGVAAAILTLWLKRKHGPAEVEKLRAEARSIEVRDDIAIGDSVLKLVKEVAIATVEAERLRDQCEHWQRKAGDLQQQLDLLVIEVDSADYQMRKQMNFIKAIDKESEYLKLDQPKSE